MSRIKDCSEYIPGAPAPVVKPGEFVFSAIGLNHGHIYDQCNGLIAAGATLKSVYDPDVTLLDAFCAKYPQVRRAASENEILSDPDVRLVAGAAIPSERCALGLRVMDAGKDYFTDKAPMTTLDQLENAKNAVLRTGKKYMPYYSERVHVEAAVLAGYMIRSGAIGRVVQVLGMGPHRLSAKSRPDWFFIREKYGGILCDIGCHQIEQILYYSGAKDATVTGSRIANFNNPEYPELDDFGEASLLTDTGASGYCRVDWFTPGALQGWGDGRTFILGTEGFIELRKYMNLGTDDGPGNLFLANGREENWYNATGKTGHPFFGQLILDCLNRTENAITQEHALKAAELALIAQRDAVVIE